MEKDKIMDEAIQHLSQARKAFLLAKKQNLILGNDNHIGDIGEYWVRKHFIKENEFKEYASKKNAPYDLELNNKLKVSVKTITAWSETGYGTQIKPLCGKDWQLLAVVFLTTELLPEKIALVPLEELVNHEPFISNIQRRKEENTKAFPRVQWWSWLDNYTVKL